MFPDTADPGYREVLAQIRASAKGLLDHPRTDMPGAQPVLREEVWGRFH
jgi:hypothetical protein